MSSSHQKQKEKQNENKSTKTWSFVELCNSNTKGRKDIFITLGRGLDELKTVPATVVLSLGENDGVDTVSSKTSPERQTLPGMEEKYLERNLQDFKSLASAGRDESYNCSCDTLTLPTS